MFISVKFANFRSYYREQELSLVAKKEQLLKENTFRTNPSVFNGRLLKTSMIAGSNASGKTNLFQVVSYIRYLVLCSSDSNREKRNIFKDNNETFALFQDAEKVPMCFEIKFLADSRHYFEYKLKIRNFAVEYEALYQRTATESMRLSNLKCLFEREADKLVQSSEEFDRLTSFVEIKPTVLLLSNCNSDIKDDICPSGKLVVKWFEEINYLNSRTASLEIYEENSEYLSKAAKILQKSDKSLKALKINKTKLDIPLENQNDPDSIIKALKNAKIPFGSGALALLEDGLYQIDISVEYNVYKNIETMDDPIDSIQFSVFDSNSKISLGQAKLIRSLAYVLKVLDTGGVLFWDELDSQLHHQFPELITDAFNDPEINKHNAQLIFTTHSTTLLDNHFRRDQINIVTKDDYGISAISHPKRESGRVKNTSKLSSLWITNEINKCAGINLDDLRKILKQGE